MNFEKLPFSYFAVFCQWISFSFYDFTQLGLAPLFKRQVCHPEERKKNYPKIVATKLLAHFAQTQNKDKPQGVVSAIIQR